MSDLTDMCDAIIIDLAPDIAKLNPHEAATKYDPLTLANNMVGFARLIADKLTPPSPTEIDDAISEWHVGAGGTLELSDFLGWSLPEYSAWVSDPACIPQRPLSPVALDAINARRFALAADHG